MAIRIALFDLGRTLVRGDPAVMFARRLRAEGRFPDEAWRALGAALVEYRRGDGDPDRAVDAANAAFASAFAGMPPGALAALAEAAVRDSLSGEYYGYARPVVATLGAAGFRTAAVTGVADPLASLLGHDLGLDETYATALEVVDGRLTGRTRFEGRSRWKEARIEPLLRAAGGDLAEAFAFGDSPADLAMLERVGKPVVVNAEATFAERVRARGWPVLDEGDDVAGFVADALGRRAWHDGRTRPSEGAGASVAP
jgi:putative phosphoserine phosphatase/1-acylglycerol-3-phosphate O-acyltransferase